MACMCGDIRCSSCGPAQGNWKCPICGQWADEPCQHMTEDGQNIRDEFIMQAEEADRRAYEAEEELWAGMEDAFGDDQR